MQYLHRDPEVLLLPDFLSARDCEELVAASVDLERSPVAYAGWTEDVSEVLRLWLRGPAIWCGLFAFFARADLLVALEAFGLSTLLAFGGALLWTNRRRAALGQQRTSRSKALEGKTNAEIHLISKFSALLDVDPAHMEAVTLIKYEPFQFLKPHFDANDAGDVEDQDRGGQTLATLLVYLNTRKQDDQGGETRFNDLGPLDVVPRQGDACLFFPAHLDSLKRDQRLRHEGRPPLGENPKHIARIWLHHHPVKGQAGLDQATIDRALAARHHAATTSLDEEKRRRTNNNAEENNADSS